MLHPVQVCTIHRGITRRSLKFALFHRFSSLVVVCLPVLHLVTQWLHCKFVTNNKGFIKNIFEYFIEKHLKFWIIRVNVNFAIDHVQAGVVFLNVKGVGSGIRDKTLARAFMIYKYVYKVSISISTASQPN